MIQDKRHEVQRERDDTVKAKRDKAEKDALRLSEQTVEYWVEHDEKAKFKQYKGRRVEIAGRGRGTVLDAKKKGLLVAFDGNEPGWTGAVCGYTPTGDDDDMLADVLEEEQEPFEELVKTTELQKIAWNPSQFMQSEDLLVSMELKRSPWHSLESK